MTAPTPEHPSAAAGLGWPLTGDPRTAPGTAGLGWPADASEPSERERP